MAAESGSRIATADGVRIAILLTCLSSACNAQSLERNEIAFSGGTTWDWANYSPYATSVSLGAIYGYRIRRWVEFEAGVTGAINPVSTFYGSEGCFNPGSRLIWVPFRVRLILPLNHDRFELSVGAGGLYQNISDVTTSAGGLSGYNAFGGYAKTTAAIALDHRRHFWLGATPHVLIVNGSYQRDRWFLLTGDFSFRF